MSALPLPSWTSSYAALDDAALAALASRGLVRRARAEVAAGRVRLARVPGNQALGNQAPGNQVPSGRGGEGQDVAGALTVDVGQPPVPVILLPEGPGAARCPCAVPGTCLHVVAACLLLRQVVQESSTEAVPARATQGESTARGTSAQARRAERPGKRPGKRPGERPGEEPGQKREEGPGQEPGEEALAEILGWDPAVVGRVLGAAARRRASAALVGRAADELARETTLALAEDQVVVTWPGSPRVVVVPALGPRGIIVAGRHSEAAEATVRLEAVVRLFACSGRPWPWDGGTGEPQGLSTSQLGLVEAVLATVETLVAAGLSHVGRRGGQEVSRLGEQARLEALPRLSRLLVSAAGVVEAVAERQDGVQESDALSALAAAWSLATALHGLASSTGATDGTGASDGTDGTGATDATDEPPACRLARLVGSTGRSGWQEAQPGLLVPLGARWWRSASGGRGLTVRFWDCDHARMESVTTGRAAGQDPTFRRSPDASLVWGTSVDRLLSAPQRLEGARRRADGTLAPSTRTTATPSGSLDDVDLPSIAQGLSGMRRGPGAAGFERPAPVARLVLTSPGDTSQDGLDSLDADLDLELDEVHQLYVWSLFGADGCVHRLRLEETSELEVVVAALAGGPDLRGGLVGVVVEGVRPVGLFVRVGGALRLLSPTLSPVR